MELQTKIAKLSQFPHKERTQPYQSYYMKDVGYIKGSRDTLYRFDLMGIPSLLTGKSVLDMGSQLGAMSIEAYRRGAKPVVGFEYEKDFVDCAKELAQHNEMDIVYKQVNLTNLNEVVGNIRQNLVEPVDIVFALSLTKHIGVSILQIILSHFKWKVCYLEGHNCNGTLDTDHCKDIITNLVNKFDHSFIGFTEDRSIRPVWKLTKDGIHG